MTSEPTTEEGRELRDWIQRLGNGSVDYLGIKQPEKDIQAIERKAREEGRIDVYALVEVIRGDLDSATAALAAEKQRVARLLTVAARAQDLVGVIERGEEHASVLRATSAVNQAMFLLDFVPIDDEGLLILETADTAADVDAAPETGWATVTRADFEEPDHG